jgi:hypothetical protein
MGSTKTTAIAYHRRIHIPMDPSTMAIATETPLAWILAEVETINTRFHGSQYGKADPTDGDKINAIPNERVKDFFQTLIKAVTTIQECDIISTGSNDPDRDLKRRDTYAVGFQHLVFLMELVTLGISHLLLPTDKSQSGKLVYTNNSKAYMLKAGIDKYLYTPFTR